MLDSPVSLLVEMSRCLRAVSFPSSSGIGPVKRVIMSRSFNRLRTRSFKSDSAGGPPTREPLTKNVGTPWLPEPWYRRNVARMTQACHLSSCLNTTGGVRKPMKGLHFRQTFHLDDIFFIHVMDPVQNMGTMRYDTRNRYVLTTCWT